ncbi:MAG: PAC2 family protein [Actinomycetota bacterium]
MEHVTWHDHPTLRRPVLVAAFEGWNDAGDAATGAVRFLADLSRMTEVAEIDPEPFVDFAVSRPLVRLDESGSRRIEWPRTIVSAGPLPGTDRDLVTVDASEPRLRWRSYCDTILAIADELDVEMVLTFGALLADVVHSDPVGVIGAAADPSLVSRLGLRQSSYEGPTGIVGVLQHRAREAGLDSVSLWAPVPSYVSAAPSPKATLALVERAATLLDLDVADRLTLLRAEAAGYVNQVDALVDGDEDLQEYVDRIREAEAAEPLTDDPARSSNELMAELEDYLKDQGEGP